MKTKQRRDRRGRVLRTAAQRQELISEWRGSGLSQTEFCARRGVHPTTFSTWCLKSAPQASGAGNSKPGIKFMEFQMPSGSVAPIEVELPNGVRIRLRDAELCRELLPLLRGEAAC